jgi:hypothetical protein
MAVPSNGEYRPMRSSSLTVTSFSEFRPVGRQLGSYTSVNNISGNRNSHWSAASRATDSQEATRSLEHLVQTQGSAKDINSPKW